GSTCRSGSADRDSRTPAPAVGPTPPSARFLRVAWSCRTHLDGLRHYTRGPQFTRDDVVVAECRVHFAEHADPDPEGRLRVDRPARHRAGLAQLVMQIVVDVHDAHMPSTLYETYTHHILS